MLIPLVNLKKQYKTIKPEIDKTVERILKEGNFILGKEVEEFEYAFAKYCKTKYCVGVASGTDALLLGLQVLGIGSGDEVITTANTFVATILPIVYRGGRPVLIDINPMTYQMDIEQLKKAITKKTKVIIPVHLYGIPAPMDEILPIARRYKIKVLEDACQAHGASLDGKRCGSFGDLAAFSFYPGKNLGAAGDAGAITTNNKKFVDKLYAMRNIGQFEKYKHDILGYNSRLDTIHAAVLSVKLKKLDAWNARRRKLAALYNELLKDLPVVLPPKLDKEYLVNYHLYVIRTSRRDKLLKFLKEENIFCGIHYPIPAHLQKALSILKYHRGDFPVSEKYAKELLSLPIYPELTKTKVQHICSLIKKFFTENEE